MTARTPFCVWWTDAWSQGRVRDGGIEIKIEKERERHRGKDRERARGGEREKEQRE